MSAALIRDAEAADLPRLAHIHAACFFAQAWSEQALREVLEGPGIIALAASDGFILARAAGDEAEILTLAVLPSARRLGLGRALLEEAACRAQRAGAARLFLEVGTSNTPARALYGRLGLIAVGRRKSYYDACEDALILRSDLPLTALGNSVASTKLAPQPRGTDRDAD